MDLYLQQQEDDNKIIYRTLHNTIDFLLNQTIEMMVRQYYITRVCNHTDDYIINELISVLFLNFSFFI